MFFQLKILQDFCQAQSLIGIVKFPSFFILVSYIYIYIISCVECPLKAICNICVKGYKLTSNNLCLDDLIKLEDPINSTKIYLDMEKEINGT